MRIHLLAAAAGIATALSVLSCGPRPDANAVTPAPTTTPARATDPAPIRAPSQPEAPAPALAAAPAPSPAPSLSFRQKLVRDRDRIPNDPETRIVDLWIDSLSQCLESDQRTSGDRYLCLDTLLDQRLRLDQASPDRKLRIASAVAAPFVRGKLPASASGRILAFESLNVIGDLRLESSLTRKIRKLISSLAVARVDSKSAQVFVGESHVRAAELDRLANADVAGGAE